MPVILPATASGWPVGVECDKKCVTPLPGVVIFEGAKNRIGSCVAGVESIGLRIRKVPFAELQGPSRHTAKRAVVAGAAFAVVVAKNEEQRCGVTKKPEVVALGDVLRQSLMEIGTALVDHESVAEIDEEIGVGSAHEIERLLIALRADVGIEMGISLDDEGELVAGSALGVEGVIGGVS